MNKNRYQDLLNLASALNFLIDCELFSQILREKGYDPRSFDFDVLMEVIADAIRDELIS